MHIFTSICSIYITKDYAQISKSCFWHLSYTSFDLLSQSSKLYWVIKQLLDSTDTFVRPEMFTAARSIAVGCKFHIAKV